MQEQSKPTNGDLAVLIGARPTPVPPTQVAFLFLAPPAPAEPLPRHLSPRRVPLRLRLRRLGRRVQQLVHGPLADRAFVLLAVAVVGAVIAGLVVMEEHWPSGYLGTAR